MVIETVLCTASVPARARRPTGARYCSRGHAVHPGDDRSRLPGDRARRPAGVTELFPISSLGHTVIYPNLFGWHDIVAWQSRPESPWLAFVVMLHVGSAVGLLIYFWKTWVEVVKAFFATVRQAPDRDADRAARMADHRRDDPGRDPRAPARARRSASRSQAARGVDLPLINGLILLGAERLPHTGGGP